MAVMRHLTVDGTTYDTVGEASVTQIVSSGTKVATVTIDGTGTDLYAPTPPAASSTAPSMDGTAAVGSSTAYARADHVHPTDTGRAAASHAHGSITSAGAITSDTTVASGDKIVISDSSDSSKLKRSGIAIGSDTTKFLRNDGSWAVPSGSSGGVSMSTTTATIPTTGWNANTITVHNVTGVTASNDVIVAPAPASAAAWAAAGIVCTAQGAGTLTFTRTAANTAALTANVMVLNQG